MFRNNTRKKVKQVITANYHNVSAPNKNAEIRNYFLLLDVDISNFSSDDIYRVEEVSVEAYERSLMVAIGRVLRLPQNVSLSKCREYALPIRQMHSDGFSVEYTLLFLRAGLIKDAEEDEDLKWYLKDELNKKPIIVRKPANRELTEIKVATEDLVDSKVRGKVIWFDSVKGYGFINLQKHAKKIFVHISDVKSDGVQKIEKGKQVKFTLSKRERGFGAKEVVVL